MNLQKETKELVFESVSTPETIQTVAQLAIPIWREQFTPIIGQAQVAYMLEAWQSPSAIEQQIQEGTQYFLVREPQEYIGYLAWIPHIDQTGKISKFYLLHTYHGCGYAVRMMQFLESLAIDANVKSLWLQVNRHNHRAIAFYKKCGFQRVRDRLEEIAPGYFIDDHVMEKRMQQREGQHAENTSHMV